MRSLKTRISIAAKPVDVFQVLTDFEKYPDWNPWTRVVEGRAEEGQIIKIKPYRYSWWRVIPYQLIKVRKPDLLHRRSTGMLSYLLCIDREIMIYTRTNGGAIVSSSTRFHGMFAPLANFFYGKRVLRGMRAKARALKEYCERRFPLTTT